MTDKEVMQMALNALEAPYPGIRTDFCDALTYREKVKTAIEALRTALDQPEKEWVGLTDGEINQVLSECHAGEVYPQDVYLCATARQKTECRAVEAKLKEKNT